MPTATMTVKGQVTIPKTIRDQLCLHAGDRIDFVMEDGHITLRPVKRGLEELYGMLYRPGQRTVSLEEMDEAIAAGACRTMDTE